MPARSANVNPKWADDFNTRYRERLTQTSVNPSAQALRDGAPNPAPVSRETEKGTKNG